MVPDHSPDSSGADWQTALYWRPNADTRNIFIPLEADDHQTISGFVLLDDQRLPEGGQNIIYDYAGSCFRETTANLIIHKELDHPTLEGEYTITLLKLAQSIDQCNIYSCNHAVRTAFWARQIAAKLQLSEDQLDTIELAAKLHDVGKVVVPRSVLGKPGRLNEAEWLIMRRHPMFGALILKPSAWLQPLVPLIQFHHEWFDGSGYPEGLIRDAIPLGARIIAVADSYTTMTEGRVYRPASTSLQAGEELRRWSGRQFDPQIVREMLMLIQSGEEADANINWGN